MFWGIKLYLRDPWIAAAGGAAALFFLGGIIYGLLNFNPGGEPVFLHYNSIFGVDLVGQWWRILYLPALAFGIGIINGFISLNLFPRERLAARFVAVFTVLIELAFLLEGVFIIKLNS